MPKRLLDDSFLSSPSLAKCSPRAQDAFPRFILLADDFGCFEAFPRVLLAKGWPYRTDVTEADVWGWLEEYVAAGMACLWTEKERRWCYLTGWHGAHGQKARAEYDPNAPAGTPGRHGSKRKTPTPPAELVDAVRAGARRDHDGKPPGVDREAQDGKPNDSAPARENGVSRPAPADLPANARSVPGPAVPVAVPVPVADAVPGAGNGAAPKRLPRRSEYLAETLPATTALLRALDAGGFEADYPAQSARRTVERAVELAGVESAARRVLEAVRASRAAGREPKPWLGWHLDAIQGTARPTATAAASTHSEFKGGQVMP